MKSLCLITLLVCFTFACPQSYYRGNNFDQDYDNDWEFARNSRRNNYPGINGFAEESNRGRFNDFQPQPQRWPMHQIEDRSYGLAYVLGQGYGKKLGDGIKSGIGKSILSGLDKSSTDKQENGEDSSTNQNTKPIENRQEP